MRVSKGTVIRTVCLILALINIVLESYGKSILPFTDEQISETVSLIFLIITSLSSWWKNNSFTEEAIIADGLMHDMKNASAVEIKGGAENE